LRPAYQLATHFLTNEHALKWFTHVALSELHKQGDSPGLLIRQQPITPAAIQSTRLKIAALPGRVFLTFHSKYLTLGGDVETPLEQTGGRIWAMLKQLAITTNTSVGLRESDEPVNFEFHAFINVNIAFLHIALRHPYNPQDNEEALRAFQFAFATNLVHEFAHAWMYYCHRRSPGSSEPRAFPTDALPEAGFSWTDFVRGGSVHPTCTPRMETLTCQDFHDRFHQPALPLTSRVYPAWTEQWFQRRTWDDFEAPTHRVWSFQFLVSVRQTRRCTPNTTSMVNCRTNAAAMTVVRPSNLVIAFLGLVIRRKCAKRVSNNWRKIRMKQRLLE